MRSERIQKAEEIIAQHSVFGTSQETIPYCVLAQIDEDGYPTAAAVTVSKAKGLAELTFCTGLQSNKAKRIKLNPRASACFSATDYSITLVGDMEILTDPAIKQDCWYSGLEQHFSGPEDPAYCVLRLRTQRYRMLINWEESEGTL